MGAQTVLLHIPSFVSVLCTVPLFSYFLLKKSSRGAAQQQSCNRSGVKDRILFELYIEGGGWFVVHNALQI
jgi:hypothetical protein